MQQRSGIDIRRDVVAALGDVWCAYDTGSVHRAADQPATAETAANRRLGVDPFSGVTLLVPVRDRQQLQKTGQKLLQIVQDLSSQPNGTNNLQIQVSRVNGERLISVKFGDQEESRSLSWCLTKDLLVISPSRDNVRAQVVRTQGARSLANVPSVESVFKSGGAPVLVGYQDTPKVFDRVYPSLESFAGVFGQLLRSLGGNPKATMLPPADAIRKHLSPAIAAVRWTPAGLESFGEQTLPGLNAGIAGPVVLGILVRGSQMAGSMAARDASADHLRRLAAAILNYQKTHNKFPSIAICDPQGRPLLSWRVEVLPSLGQKCALPAVPS